MKTTLKKMIISDRSNALWFKLDGEKLWGRRYPQVPDSSVIYLDLIGRNGIDLNGLSKWVIKGNGYSFLVKALFYREDDYNEFIESIDK